jgi:transposase
MRERGQLQKEVLQHRDRMRKQLATLGCRENVNSTKFATRLSRSEVRCHDGAPLPDEVHERLIHECERLALAEAQLGVIVLFVRNMAVSERRTASGKALRF